MPNHAQLLLPGTTRKGFLARTVASAGALLSYAFVPATAEARRYAHHNCYTMYYYQKICLGGSTSGCNVRVGFPSCSHSYVTAYSPSDVFYNTCHVTCETFCNCEPTYNQARAAAGNGGTCSCTPYYS